jgi:glutaredoxin 2
MTEGSKPHESQTQSEGAAAPDVQLALYFYEGCPFCTLVQRAIDDLGIEVELRDIFAEPGHRDALVAARGRPTVPVLRIMSADGEERWMPESRDIVRHLKQMYG